MTAPVFPPVFPPLFSGQAVSGGIDPFQKARIEAMKGCDAGLVVHHLGRNALQAAVVFTPEEPLAQGLTILPICAVGFQNALGALAPPEVAVHLEWAGGLRINGGACGRFRVAASTDDPEAVPDWVVVGLDLPLWPETDDPGHAPDETTLYAEGCVDVDAITLLESWIKHTLVHINTWQDEGPAALHKEWRGLAHNIGEEIEMADRTGTFKTGTFLGVDETFGLLLRDEETTHLIPLTHLLER